MRKSNIALYLSKLLPVAVLALLRVVGTRMSGNPHFLTPVVAPADMLAKADVLEVAIGEATNGSRQSKLQRDIVLRESRAMLSAQADYVRGVCLGDPAMLESSGFPLARPHEPLPAPAAPVGLEVQRTAEAGVLKVRWKGDRAVRVYKMEQQEAGGPWVLVLTTTRVKHEIRGLTTGKEYAFRVQVITPSGVSPMSETVMQRAA